MEVLITMGLTGPRDVAAIDEWIKLHADDAQAREVRQSLASLPVGTAWVWSPEWLEALQRVQVRRVTTFDSSATPKVGQRVVTPTARAAIDLDALGAEIAATVERAKEDDPAVLRARIAKLERELAARPKAQAASPVIERVEVPVEVPVQMREEDRDDLAERLRELESVVDVIRDTAAGLGATLTSVQRTLEQPVHARPAPASAARAPRPPRPAPTPPRVPTASPATLPGPRVARTLVDEDGRLSKMQKAIASALATHGVLSQRQIGLFTGYAHKSGSFANSLSGLRTRGLIDGGGQAISLTDAGLAVLDANGGYEPLPVGRDLVDWWLNRLPKAQAAMLAELLEAYPEPLSVDELAERTGYAAGSGSFANNRSKLNVAELIHGDRHALYAADTLGQAYIGG